MIVVVEGISAAGKTRWCREHAAGHVVEEAAPSAIAPDRNIDPQAAALFWTDRSAERWAAALAMEESSGLAVCDSDPLKLHYAFSLWRIGALEERAWQNERDVTRAAVADGRLGFADLYLVKRIDPEQARRQRNADPNRTRRNFELHLRLQPPLIEYYGALETLLPGRVACALPDGGVPRAAPRPRQDDGRLFDALVERLG